MTTQATGPSDAQVKALKARARAAGETDAQFAAKVGGSNIEGLNGQQVRQLFNLTNTDEQAFRERPVPTRAVATIAPEERAKLAASLGCTEDEAEVIMSVIAPDLNAAEIRWVVGEAESRGMKLQRKDGYAIKVHGRPQLWPGVDWTRAKCEPELDGPPTLEFCRRPSGDEAPVWLSLANFSESDKPHAGRARGWRRDGKHEIIFEGLYSEHHRSENAWIQYDLHMFGLSLERQFYRHACAATLRGLYMELPPPDQLDAAARVYMWASAAEHGYTHDDVHLLFGILPEDSLTAEIERRGMDWRDAVQFVAARIKGHGDLPAMPKGLAPGSASDLYDFANRPALDAAQSRDASILSDDAPPRATAQGEPGDGQPAQASQEHDPTPPPACPVCGEPCAVEGFDDDGRDVYSELCGRHLAERDLPPEVVDAASLVAAAMDRGLRQGDVATAAKAVVPTWPRGRAADPLGRAQLAPVWAALRFPASQPALGELA